jgi:hypothetical protein
MAESATKVVHITTDWEGGSCDDCGAALAVRGYKSAFEENVNHYLGHGYKLLHVGQETGRDDRDQPFQITAAVLGK